MRRSTTSWTWTVVTAEISVPALGLPPQGRPTRAYANSTAML
ncbi:hypothetical protein [Streptomyces heilongjiangensis]|uniref:Uncharacterized protein n=1 Tax=Streptomyces heilongjiangensis TaxID=945052 RepID=A0ABW1BHJ5_9ACTN|nr:hypothetical protein [Streptomyces heilongjiangensis]MDC2951051.1 hypothetical protein [Streptomyces heilongjiangensis]